MSSEVSAKQEIIKLEKEIKKLQLLLYKKEQKVYQIKRDLNIGCEYCSKQFCTCKAMMDAYREANK